MKRLYYFTDAYPFSVDYTWKSAEIKAAADLFEEVIIVPYTYRKDNEFSFPENVRVEKPTLGKSLFAKPKHLWRLFALSQPQNWLKELLRALPKGKQAIISWYLATIYSHIIIQKPIFKELKSLDEKDKAVLFFQWTMNNALLVPNLKSWGFKHIVCRMHGFDLYEFRHQGYLPYKATILEAVTVCTFISEHGKKYAENLYPFINSKAKVHYLGANPFPKNILNDESEFHLLSISRAVPLKRLNLVLEALKVIDFPIKWTHIGDGPSLSSLQEDAKELMQHRSDIEVIFTGWLDPAEIEDFVGSHSVNALILVSETEGLPVAIMEAFSAGIPAIATDVGGVSELVDEDNGILLSADPTVEEIQYSIIKLKQEVRGMCENRRTAALQKYSQNFELKRNSKSFAEFLLKQTTN